MPADKPATRTERDTLGTVEVPADRYYGAQTARSLHFFAIGDDRMPQPVIRAIGILKKAAALANRDLGQLPPNLADLIVRGGRRGDRRQARRSFPAARLADRQRHADEHERQRGDRQPGQRAGRRPARQQDAGPPERSRQHVAVVERHLSDGHAHRRGRGDRPEAAAGRAGTAGRPGDQGRRVRGHRQDRPDAPDGRRAADAGPGVLRLRRPARFLHRRHQADAAGALRTGPRRHRGRHRAERSAGVRRRRPPKRSPS